MSIRLLGLLVLVLLAAPSAARAHSQPWYWSQASAEEAIENDPEEYAAKYVWCHGYGPTMRSKRGVKLYKHFRCTLNDDDLDTVGEGRLHVASKHQYYWYWAKD